MSFFGELNEPSQDASGYWVVMAKHSFLHYLCNDRIEVANLMHNTPDDFYFKTEEDCHAAAAAYYALFGGRPYPYMLEWAALENAPDVVKGLAAQHDIIESETMEFI